jgi:hypothetical protein
MFCEKYEKLLRRVTSDNLAELEIARKKARYESQLDKSLRVRFKKADAQFDRSKSILFLKNQASFRTPDDLSTITKIDKIQNTTEIIYKHALEVVSNTERINIPLAENTAQIARISENVEEMIPDVERARKLIATFNRRMATDKIIQAVTAINVLIIVLLIGFVLKENY